jgi:hypothetical protein
MNAGRRAVAIHVGRRRQVEEQGLVGGVGCGCGGVEWLWPSRRCEWNGVGYGEKQARWECRRSLEVVIHGEDARVGVAVDARHHTALLVLAHTLLEEVGLPPQRDELHPVERVLCVVHLGTV